MGVADALNYIIFTNPISSTATSAVVVSTKAVTDYIGLSSKKVEMSSVPLWKLAASTGPYIKLAALNGMVAVMLGAYGSHKLSLEKFPEEQRKFDTANKYHFFHTLALLGLPMCKRPVLAAIFFTSGIVLFCGSCYYSACTNDTRFSRVTPFGGICFILGWLSMAL